jgi:hypothetical protein
MVSLGGRSGTGDNSMPASHRDRGGALDRIFSRTNIRFGRSEMTRSAKFRFAEI